MCGEVLGYWSSGAEKAEIKNAPVLILAFAATDGGEAPFSWTDSPRLFLTG
jgi:hypothetical protein